MHISDKHTLAEFVVDSREEAISKYREYLLNNECLMSRIHELDGKVLGCWCIKDNSFPIPYVCHGQVLIEVLTQMKLHKFFNKPLS